MIRREKPEYELPIDGVAWTRGSGHPAGMFLLGGRCHLVALGSPAEELLVERGAIHFASVTFEPPPMATSEPRPLRLVRAVEAARWGARGREIMG
jgi:hypothetical protein